MMKKTMILLLGILLAMPVSAQFNTHRTPKRNRFNHNNTEQYYGLRLGLNVASISSDDVRFDTDSRTGVAFGAVYGFQLANSTPLWLEAGAFYSEKGGRNHTVVRNNPVPQKVTDRLSYLQVPVVCKYSFDVYDDLYIQPFLGGYLALGIAGKTKEYGTAAQNYRDRDAHSVYDDLNRFDGGLRLGCGVEYQMVYAEAGFDFGLANISGDDFDSTHTRCFFLSVGVNF